ncbi:MAG: hypothetical protein Q8P84_06345 [Deltaproteobacteria bacterium]|nr:hypothetical protein [Deltaproteobacteria bacterium]
MQLEDLIKLLNDRHAEYLIIGAHALAAHGYTRATSDLDILINPAEENVTKVRAALEAFGYDTTDASLEDFQTKKILFRQYIYDVDIHPSASGVETDLALKNKIQGTFEGVSTHYASLDDMIEMKKAAARDDDLKDLKYLEEIKRQLSQKKKK